MRKAIYIGALLLLTFASAGGAARKSTIKVIFTEQANGDYRVFLFGSDRSLVCEESAIHIVQQGDAVNPLVIECQHRPYIRPQ